MNTPNSSDLNPGNIDLLNRLSPPVYQDSLVTLYCGNSLQLLPLVPECDLLLTDPPYGIKVAPRGIVGSTPPQNSRRRGWATKARSTQFGAVDWDNAAPPLWMMQLAMSRARWSIIWGGGHVGGMPRATCWLIWDKRNDGLGFSNAEIAWTNLPRAVRMFRWLWSGCRQQDMAHKERRIHPTQKPVPVLEWCMGFLPDASTVLDPFAGSASTLIAARKLGKRAIGIERSAEYCERAIARLKQQD